MDPRLGWRDADRPSITKIVSFLPPKSARQTVLFSATYPKDIKALVNFACTPGHLLIDTIQEDEAETATKVPTGPHSFLPSFLLLSRFLLPSAYRGWSWI